MTLPKFQVRHIAFREWLLLSLFLLALTAVLVKTPVLENMNQVLYDRLMQMSQRPARDDILIVAIDDYSIKELGKWPWPRQRHAELLQQLGRAKPLAIGLDVLFSEAADPDGQTLQTGDQALAQAIANANNVVLPMASENTGQGLGVVLPLPQIASAARQISHIHIELDRDGIARSVFLREGMNGEWWPHFALAIKNVGQNIAAGTENFLPGERLPLALRKNARAGIWQRDYQIHIPYAGNSGHFRSVPYVSVLRGEVPASFIQNKYVIVGPTAVGMADSFPTPVSGNDGLISGVEINANILAALLNQQVISIAPDWMVLIWNLALVTAVLLAYQFLSPRKALLISGLGLLANLLAAFLWQRFGGIWFAPSASIIAVLLAYPLWSWRRLEAAINYLREEFSVLEKEPHLLPEYVDPELKKKQLRLTDQLEASIQAVHVAADRVRDLRQFVTDSLASLPDATLVTTVDGNVLLSNQSARQFFASLGYPKVNDALLPYLFAKITPPQSGDASASRAFSWWDLLDLQQTSLLTQGIEVKDPQQQDLLIKSAPCYNSDKFLVGWIVSIINLSAIRAAERSRDETLHFISHDMRAPQASILALLEMQKDPATALALPELMSRIEKASRITLGLADNFVQLARAESQDYRFSEADFQDILLEATEEMWSLAKNKNIRIQTQVPEGDYPVRVDRSLMTRVLTNLLSNAIKYSPHNTRIQCSLELEQHLADTVIICTISDQGYGIPRAEQSKLFQRFQRFHNADQPKNDGIGLGMVFIKAVLDRHHAQISFTSAPNEGTTFRIRLPAVGF